MGDPLLFRVLHNNNAPKGMVTKVNIVPAKKRYYLGTLVLLSVLLFIAGVQYYNYRHTVYQKEYENYITAIAQLKSQRIAEWYADELHDAAIIAGSSFLQENLIQFLDSPTSERRKRIEQYFFQLIAEHDYSAILLVSQDGKVLASTLQQTECDTVLLQTISFALRTYSTVSTDLYRTRHNDSVAIDFVVACRNIKPPQQCVLVFRKNPHNDLYPLILELPAPSKTAETILLRQVADSIEYLNELRHRTNTALRYKLSMEQKNLPSVQAASGKKGIFIGKDYRGADVLAYLSHIPGTRWYMVSKIDTEEVFHDFQKEQIAIVSVLVLLLFVFTGFAGFFYSYRQRNIYRKAWEAETEFRTTLYSIGDAVITTDREGRVKYLNRVAESLTGWSEREAYNKDIEEVFHIISEEARQRVENPVKRVLKEGVVIGLANHTLLLSHDGKEIPIADSGAPICDEDGTILGVVLVFRDQTAERQAQRKLEEAREFAENVVETLRGPLLVLDENFRIISANRAYYRLFNTIPEETIGLNFFEIHHHQWDQPELRTALGTILSQNTRPENVEISCSSPTAGKRTFLVNASRMYREANNTNLILLALEDITERKRAEETLRLSEEKFRVVFSVLPDVIMIINAEGKYVEVLPTNPHLLYRPADELVGKTFSEVFEPDQATQFLAAVQTCLRSQKPVTLDYQLSIEGKKYWFSATVIPFQQNTVLFVASDITKRKEMEQELRESEEWFRKLADTTTTAIFIYQGKRFVYVNKTACHLSGYTTEELLSMQFWDIVHPDDREMVRQRGLARQQGAMVPDRYQFRIVRKDGAVRWLDFAAGKIDWYGTPAGLGSAFDITEQKIAEEQLRERERTFATLLSNLHGFAYRCANDKDWTMLFISQGCKEITGYEADDFIGNKTLAFNDIIHPDYQELLWNLWQKKLPKHEVFEYEYPIITKSGTIRWVWERGRGVYDSNGRLLFLEGFITDITQRKIAEDTLRRERHLLRTIINNLPDAIYAKDLNGRKTLANNVDIQNLGVKSEEEVLGKDDFAFFPHDIASAFYKDDLFVLQTGNAIINREERIRFADGTYGYLLTSKVPLRDEHGKIIGLVGIGHNITDRKRAEEALRKSEALYKEFVENDLTGDFIATPSGTIRSCNNAFVRIFGFTSSEEAIGTSISSLFLSPERWQKLLLLLKERPRLEYYEVAMRRRDGKEVFAVMNIVGKTDKAGLLTEVMGYIFDDTRRHELEKQIIQTQKLESIGILAGGIAHDFNNILGIILGYTSLLEQESAKQQISAKNLEIIRKAVERGAALVRQILTFARQTDIHTATVNVNTVINELRQMIFETFPRIIEIKTDCDPHLLPVLADQTQLHQAFLNLAVNARDAMPQGGTLLFKTYNVDGATVRQKFPNATADRYVCVAVQDTGCGIPEEHLKNIFEPFFTTKERGKGTGLGLAVVYGVISSHQGFIDVASTVGKGTTFFVYLPVSELLDVQQEEAETKETIQTGSGTVLLVEDEDALREIAASVLEGAGYTVFAAADGEEALTIFERESSTIDIVLTDLGLPKMDGAEVIKRLLQKKPSLHAIVGSGYFEPEKREELQKLGVQLLLQKPYKPQELLAGIHRILHHR